MSHAALKPFQFPDNTTECSTTKSSTKRNSILQEGIWSIVLMRHIRVLKHSQWYVCKKRPLKDHVCWFLVCLKCFSGCGRLQDFLIILVWPPTHCLHPWVASNNHSSVLSLFYVEQSVTSIPIRNGRLNSADIKRHGDFLFFVFNVFKCFLGGPESVCALYKLNMSSVSFVNALRFWIKDKMRQLMITHGINWCCNFVCIQKCLWNNQDVFVKIFLPTLQTE